jgi:hypothetical protein
MVQCQICGHAFQNAYALNNHNRIHKRKHLENNLEQRGNDYAENNHNDEHHDIDDINEGINQPYAAYYKLQFNFCSEIYGEKAFRAESWEEFAHSVLSEKYKGGRKAQNAMKIYAFSSKVGLSRHESYELLDLIKDISSSNDNVHDPEAHKKAYFPRGWNTLQRSACDVSDGSEMPTLSATVSYPERWRIDRWREAQFGKPPPKIEIFSRDVIACISQQLMDPAIAFGMRHHIQMEYMQEFFEGMKVLQLSHFVFIY